SAEQPPQCNGRAGCAQHRGGMRHTTPPGLSGLRGLRGLGVLVRADIDLPAGELRGQPGVLAVLADGEGELVLGDHRANRPADLVDHHHAADLDGDSALVTNAAGSSSKSTMSIFSPPSSFITARTRAPIGPMQAPLALTPAMVARTAILVR